MITESVDGHLLLILGLAGCKINDPAGLLGKLRAEFPKQHIQLMRADRLAGKEHLVLAADSALRAAREGYMRSQSLAMEVLLYTSCQRQISKAIQMLGVTPRTREVVLLALSSSERTIERLAVIAQEIVGGRPYDGMIEVASERKAARLMKAYDISDVELKASKLPGEVDRDALKRLIVERSALLSLKG